MFLIKKKNGGMDQILSMVSVDQWYVKVLKEVPGALVYTLLKS